MSPFYNDELLKGVYLMNYRIATRCSSPALVGLGGRGEHYLKDGLVSGR